MGQSGTASTKSGCRRRRAGRLVFDRKKNEPLPDRFVPVMRSLGLEAERFASSTGPLRGLETL